jgi:hypothetical protein
MKLNVPALCAVIAVILSGCTTSQQGSAGKEDLARAARGIIGTSLIGTRGATPRDQDNIDDTIAGSCAVGVFTKAECERHTRETQ